MTRFKGLGEISPDEFTGFLQDRARLIPVAVGSVGEVAKVLDFFMGKNTPERRAFIVDHLSPDVVQA